MFDLVFSRRYSMAHRLIAGPSKKCAIPHGHNEVVTINLKPVHPNRLDGAGNMVESFERAKARWHGWIDNCVDHAFQLSNVDPLIEWFQRFEPHRLERVLITPGDPTTEMLACCFKAKLSAFLLADGDSLTCVAVRIEETPTNTVIFSGEPRAALPLTNAADPWWFRPDTDINDLVADGGDGLPAEH